VQLIRGGIASQVVGAVAAFGVPDLLAGGPRDVAELGQELDIEPQNLYRLLRAAATVGVLDEIQPRTFGLNQMGERLRSDVPLSLRELAITATDPGQWLPWSRFREAVRTGKGQVPFVLGTDVFSYWSAHPEERAHFAAAMGNRTELLTAALLDGYDFSPFRQAVDVGGAQGHLLAAILQKCPRLRGIVFDQPGIVSGALAVLDAKGVANRCEVVAGDFFDSVPPGADLYLLKSVIHDWPDEAAVRILTRVREAMDEAGSVMVIDYLLPPDGERGSAHSMDLTMMVMLGARERTIAEFRELFEAAKLRLTETVLVADHVLAIGARA
jgi:hypothetical protein